jgi:hypothetical protein
MIQNQFRYRRSEEKILEITKSPEKNVTLEESKTKKEEPQSISKGKRKEKGKQPQ